MSLEEIKKEAAIRQQGYRCGECRALWYCREYERWECSVIHGYQNPASPACVRFKQSKGAPVEGTFENGYVPERVQQRKTEAYAALEKLEDDEHKECDHPKTNYEALMESFKDQDKLLDLLEQRSCQECEHVDVCELAWQGDLDGCREFLRSWLNEPARKEENTTC